MEKETYGPAISTVVFAGKAEERERLAVYGSTRGWKNVEFLGFY